MSSPLSRLARAFPLVSCRFVLAVAFLASCDAGNDSSTAGPEDPGISVLEDLHSPDPGTRLLALKRLGTSDEDASSAIPVLIDFLRDDQTASHAARVLGRLGEEARPAVPYLIAALRSESPDVRVSAEKALVELGSLAVPDLVMTLQKREIEADLPLASTWFGRLVQEEPGAVTAGLAVTALASLVALVALVKMWIGHRERLAKLGLGPDDPARPEGCPSEVVLDP